MRDILFRGKDDRGNWRYGDLLHLDGDIYIYEHWRLEGTFRYHVNPETVGQYTGMHDNALNRIFEGDIVKVTSGAISTYSRNGYVVYDKKDGKFSIITIGQYGDLIFSDHTLRHMVVIGNIHDNPELLEEE